MRLVEAMHHTRALSPVKREFVLQASAIIRAATINVRPTMIVRIPRAESPASRFKKKRESDTMKRGS
jgi:hypothetical protein